MQKATFPFVKTSRDRDDRQNVKERNRKRRRGKRRKEGSGE
jgi:hypothetical protein